MSRRRLVVATRNRHKLKEIRAVLADLDLELLGVEAFEGCPEVEEDGATLEANAEKKARETAAYTGLLTLADDSGLEVDALHGEPGVYSARWAGVGASFDDNNRKLLERLRDVPETARTARFRCVMALVDPHWGPVNLEAGVDKAADFEPLKTHPGRLELFEGRLEGLIATVPRGSHGFGYDPLFHIPSLGSTLAELELERKNQVSHRALALRAVRAALGRRLDRP